MKRLSILLSITLIIFICSCGGNSSNKEEAKNEVKKETKKLSKDTKEGMMAILEASDIKVPEELAYVKVEKKSDSYVITFKNDSISDEGKAKVEEWFARQLTEMENAGWKKRATLENEEMMGVVANEILMYPPSEKDIDVTYGLTLSTSYVKDKKSYTFYVNAN